MNAILAANLALRFLLEVAALVAMGAGAWALAAPVTSTTVATDVRIFRMTGSLWFCWRRWQAGA